MEREKLMGILIGFGKASLKMGAAVENALGPRLTQGLLVTDRRSVTVKSEVIVAGHPLPDEDSLLAGKRIVDVVSASDEETLLIFLISGGGSALVECLSSTELTLEDLQALNRVIVHCGASIREVNTVRKRLSRIKGGGLRRFIRGSKVVALYLSDVNSSDLATIASGPLLEDAAGDDDLLSVIEKYALLDRLPVRVARTLAEGLRRSSGTHVGKAVDAIHVLVGDNLTAVKSATAIAETLGFRVETETEQVEGDYRVAADRLIDRMIALGDRSAGEDVCLISGGEVACAVVGKGVGGRNQEFVVYSAERLTKLGRNRAAAVLSGGTDGIDGNSCAAAAATGTDMLQSAEARGMDVRRFIEKNNSHSFLKAVGGLVFTGPTGTNIRDIRVFLAGKGEP